MEDYRLTAVYKKEDAIISLYEDDDHDFIYISDSRDRTWVKIPEWDYDIDEYDFMYLEDGYDIFYFGQIIIARLADSGHITLDLPVAAAERHYDFHAGRQLIFKFFRDAVLKYLIQFFMLYIYDHICKHTVTFPLLILPEPLRSARARPSDTSHLLSPDSPHGLFRRERSRRPAVRALWHI